MNTYTVDKKSLRKEYISKRDVLHASDREKASEMILKELEKERLFNGAKNILLFASFGSELPTDNIFKLCKKLGKSVYYPKVVEKDIIFYKVEYLSELSSGFHGIREPSGETEKYIFSDESGMDLIIMPGVAFDNEGYRLGYGGGFYDRFLAKMPVFIQNSIAIGYKMQETEHIPADEHDVKPGKIILV